MVLKGQGINSRLSRVVGDRGRLVGVGGSKIRGRFLVLSVFVHISRDASIN